jgi:high-affinity iron transporter
MLASLLIVFREILEAGLIVGIVLAASEGVPARGRWVAGGVGAGILGAALVALFAGALSQALAGIGQELFTVAILCVAVMMLGWHIIWMARHGREMAAEMSATSKAVKNGDKSLLALAVVIAVAVLREGSEVVLFLYGIAVSTNEGPMSLLLGGLLGVGLGALVSYLLYRGLVIIPVRHLFRVTNGLVALLAAGMAGQAAALLSRVDLIPTWGNRLWDSSRILAEDSLVGRALHALVGYSDRPAGVQVAAYIVTLIVLVACGRVVANAPRKATTGASLHHPLPESR